jgi:hypothetical protein
MVLDTLKILSEYCSDRISKVPWGEEEAGMEVHGCNPSTQEAETGGF